VAVVAVLVAWSSAGGGDGRASSKLKVVGE